VERHQQEIKGGVVHGIGGRIVCTKERGGSSAQLCLGDGKLVDGV
jgi:hypothetical protein